MYEHQKYYAEWKKPDLLHQKYFLYKVLELANQI